VAERVRIGVTEVRGLQPGQEAWDDSVRGFGVRRRTGTAVAYFVMYRTTEGRLRRYTIGTHGQPWTPTTARTEALRILGMKAKGEDPAATKQATRRAETVAELCEQYMADAEAGHLLTRRRAPKRVTTLIADRSRIERHVKPVLGSMKVASVTPKDVETLMSAIISGKTAGPRSKRGGPDVRGGRGAASRTIGLLGGVFSYAVKRKLRADNPVRGVLRPADGRRDRRLSDAEYAVLGTGLRAAAERDVWPAAIEAVRFLALTGWRSSEVVGLRRSEADLVRRTAILADTKTGRSIRPLSNAACEVLSRASLTDDLLFPASRADGRMILRKRWLRIAKLGRLPADITPHTLRHSFASVAADLGYSESTIGTLIGHTQQSMTSRYIHGADAVLLAAADAVAQRISELMDGKPQATHRAAIDDAPIAAKGANDGPAA
jgi:integrase